MGRYSPASDQFFHNGFTGSIEWSEVDQIFFGRLRFILDIVTYESPSRIGLEEEFRKAVTKFMGANTLQLLQLAAKAIDLISITYTNDYDGRDGIMVTTSDNPREYSWDPLNDSATAFDLAMKLRLSISITANDVEVTAYDFPLNEDGSFPCSIFTIPGTLTGPTVRAAIVRCAAKIGKRQC